MLAVVEFNHIGAKEIGKMLEVEARLVNPYEETDMTTFDGIILSGSSNPNVSYNPSEYSKSLISELTTVRVPILGICFGMQFLATFYGGEVDEDKSHGWEVVCLDNQTDLLADHYPRELVYMSHDLGVSKLPVPHNDFRVIAVTWENAIAGFRHKFLPVYGVMWHPERMSKRGPILFRNFEMMCQTEHQD